MLNSVILVGRLGQDPEIKYFESGSMVARFSIAVDRNFSKTNKITDWFNVEVWGRQAEFVSEWVKKGAMVSVAGQVEVQRWTDNTGNTRERQVIRAQDVRFVGTKRDNAGGGGYNAGGGSYAGNPSGNSYEDAAAAPVVPF